MGFAVCVCVFVFFFLFFFFFFFLFLSVFSFVYYHILIAAQSGGLLGDRLMGFYRRRGQGSCVAPADQDARGISLQREPRL